MHDFFHIHWDISTLKVVSIQGDTLLPMNCHVCNCLIWRDFAVCFFCVFEKLGSCTWPGGYFYLSGRSFGLSLHNHEIVSPPLKHNPHLPNLFRPIKSTCSPVTRPIWKQKIECSEGTPALREQAFQDHECDERTCLLRHQTHHWPQILNCEEVQLSNNEREKITNRQLCLMVIEHLGGVFGSLMRSLIRLACSGCFASKFTLHHWTLLTLQV